MGTDFFKFMLVCIWALFASQTCATWAIHDELVKRPARCVEEAK